MLTVILSRYWRNAVCWFAVSIAAATSACHSMAIAAGKKLPYLEPVSCWFSVPEGKQAQCGYLHVKESRSRRDSSEIRIPFLQVKSAASSEQRKTDAVLIPGAGGPGNPLDLQDESMAQVWSTYDWILNNGRDVVFADPRGVGLAEPELSCSELQAIVPMLWGSRLDEDTERSILVKQHTLCKERLAAQGIDLNEYNTLSSGRDFEELRQALGYSQWNVYGTSYGGTIALEMLRSYPDQVRSVILDSVQAPDVRFFQRYREIVGNQLNKLVSLCGADAECARDFPDLGGTIKQLVPQLNEKPAILLVADPADLTPFPVMLTGDGLLGVIRSALYQEEAFSELPQALTAMSRGSSDLISPYVRGSLLEDMDAHYSDGVYLSVTCREEIPFSDLDKAIEEVKSDPVLSRFVVSTLRYMQAVCKLWDVRPAGKAEVEPARSSIPALIIGGELDGVTPADWTATLPQFLTRAQRFVFAGYTHDVIAASYCATLVAEQFLQAPTDPVRHSCLAEQRSVNFRTLATHRGAGSRRWR